MKNKKRSGQSLIEMMIAITVLTVGFLGISALLSQSLFLNRIVANEATATYLASEGIELAKNLIDHDVYAQVAGQGTGWGTCFSGKGTSDFEIDYTTVDCSTLAPFVSPGSPLWYSSQTHLYSYNAGGSTTRTNFARDIRVNVNGDEIVVRAIVSWTGAGGVPQSINMEDHFYKWY